MKHSFRNLYPLLGLLAMSSNVTHAGLADLADVPLANATTVSILPNIGFILDDSGSMNDENMPNDDGTNKTKLCWKWHGYNTLYYNPATTYLPPITYNGTSFTRFLDASFTAALKDGYFASTAKMYDGTTNNGTIDLNTLGGTSSTKSTIVFESLGSSKYKVTSVSVTRLDGSTLELLNSTPVPSAGTDVTDTLGQNVRDSINAKTSTNFTATYDDGTNTLTITAPASQAGLTTTPTMSRDKVSGTNRTVTIGAFSPSYSSVFYATHNTNPNSTTCDADSSYTGVGSAGSIAAPNTTAGSAAAKTNFANWYSYYRKRAFLAKAAAGEAFAGLEDNKYRVGLFFINSIQSGLGAANNDLAINAFTGSHRANWFTRLYSTRKDSGTPLRSALSRMGRMYAGQISGWDPVQYSCQRNFSILTSDGYWNDTSGYKKIDGTTDVGSQDTTSVPRPSYDSSAVSNTLADVAYYYYHTDLRPNTCTSPDVCTDNVKPAGTNTNVDDVATHQHMTTFTIGLGVSGDLTYQDGYKTSTSGDYFAILQGSKNWPNPNTDTRKIDDLWHAAVNGRGTYFSAKNAATFADAIGTALGTIEASSGSGAAAATSNLQPTTDDNQTYIASFRTIFWDGQISARTIDLSTGAISTATTWQAATQLNSKIATNGSSDTRVIKTWDSTGTNKVKDFSWANLTTTEKTYFNNSLLSQYTGWTAGDVTAGTGDALVNYLRGQDRNEDQLRDDSYGAYNRLYRDRETALGDIVHSQPIYVKAPFYDFLDTGYATYKTGLASRSPTLYVAANDGMLHAFDAATGNENWAYFPPTQLKDIWRLADQNYSTNHRYYLDGPIAVSDANLSGTWKTILVGAMGKGGRGIYAMDITDPATPIALWNYTAEDNQNLGYTYGTPIITKLSDGTWVVVIASGYNNVPEGANYTTADGQGRVFVLNAATGALIRTINTAVGDTATPSGLAHLNIQVPDFQRDNTALAAYGGDLLGNMWRFNLNTGAVSKVVALGSNKPISVMPEIGEVNGSTALFFGTGRYLGEDDLLLTNTQSFYAIRDDGTTTVNVASNLVLQTMANTADRTITGTSVDWDTQYGWYFDLPESKERVNLRAQLFFGTVLFSSVVPANSECQPGGKGYLYAIDYNSGLRVSGATQNVWAYTSPLVGQTVAKLPGGDTKVIGITADGGYPTGAPPSLPISSSGGAGGESGNRVMWRELMN